MPICMSEFPPFEAIKLNVAILENPLYIACSLFHLLVTIQENPFKDNVALVLIHLWHILRLQVHRVLCHFSDMLVLKNSKPRKH